MKMGRMQTWIALILVPVGLLVMVILGIVGYRSSRTPLYPNAESVPSIRPSAPSPQWAGAADQARQLVRASVAEQNIPGLSVAVGVGGAVVWAEGFGWADVENRVQAAPQTRFRIGHVSKTLTSAAAGLLLEQGQLHLHDEIQKYVPAFPAKQWPITLRELMAHVSGVRHYNERDDMPTEHCERASDGMRSFANDPLRFEPDTRYGYSTYGWVLVSEAIEAASGDPFLTFMRSRIFEPLRMDGTTIDAPHVPDPDRAKFYFGKFGGEAALGPDPAADVDYSCLAGGGGFVSTSPDLVKFAMALQSGKLLKADTVKMLQTPQELRSGEQTSYGLGWMLESASLAGESSRMVGHTSRSLLGGSTSFWIFPDRGIAVAVTANISFVDSGSSIALKVAETFAKPQSR